MVLCTLKNSVRKALWDLWSPQRICGKSQQGGPHDLDNTEQEKKQFPEAQCQPQTLQLQSNQLSLMALHSEGQFATYGHQTGKRILGVALSLGPQCSWGAQYTDKKGSLRAPPLAPCLARKGHRLALNHHGKD